MVFKRPVMSYMSDWGTPHHIGPELAPGNGLEKIKKVDDN